MASENISAVNAVRNYVEQSSSSNRHPKTRQQIVYLLSQQEPLSKEKVLYRGVTSEFPENLKTWKPYVPSDFFSTSEDVLSAETFMGQNTFMPKDCCTLEIHVQPGVRVLDVQRFLKQHKRSVPDIFLYEEEWLVQGDGFFFANEAGTIPGFAELPKKGHYKTYYFPEIPLVPAVTQTECIGPGCAVMGGGERTLFDAIRDGNVEECKQLIADGADINQTTNTGSTPLMQSIYYSFVNTFFKKRTKSYIEIIHYLLSIPEVDVNKKDNYGDSALIQVVNLLPNEDIVKGLLKHPAIDVNISNRYGLTALDLAIKYKENTIIALLREAGGKTVAEIPLPNIAHAVRLYVGTEHSANRHPNTRSMVSEALFQQEQLMEEKLVYRGMKSEIPTNLTKFNPYFPKDFFSVSESDKIASNFMNKKSVCCVITIYLQPGVYVLDVHTFLKKHGLDNDRSEIEQEWLVEGGGMFFADKQKTTPGFAELKKNHYVTYYFPPASRVLEGSANINALKGGQRQKRKTFRRKDRKDRKNRKDQKNESQKRRRTYRK